MQLSKPEHLGLPLTRLQASYGKRCGTRGAVSISFKRSALLERRTPHALDQCPTAIIIVDTRDSRLNGPDGIPRKSPYCTFFFHDCRAMHRRTILLVELTMRAAAAPSWKDSLRKSIILSFGLCFTWSTPA